MTTNNPNSPRTKPEWITLLLFTVVGIAVNTLIAWSLVYFIATPKTDYDVEYEDLKNTVGHIQDALTGMNSLTTNYLNKLEELKSDYNRRFQDADSRITGSSTLIDNLQNEVSNINNDIDTLFEDNDTLALNITTVQTQLDTKAGKTELDAKASKTELDAKADKTALTALTTKVNDITFAIPSGVINNDFDDNRFLWTADAPYQVVKVTFQQSVLETTGANTTVMLKKVPSGTAIPSGSDILSSAINLKTAVSVNTLHNAPLIGTSANLNLTAGDSLALSFVNAITEYYGCITITLKRVSP